jgi:hypothetical protein
MARLFFVRLVGSAVRDRKQTTWVDLSPGAITALAQGQKSKCASGKARGGGGLGALKQKGRDLHGLLVSRNRGATAQAAFLRLCDLAVSFSASRANLLSASRANSPNTFCANNFTS